MILAPLLEVLSTHAKQFSLYSSNWNLYCSGLGVAFVRTPVVIFFLSVCCSLPLHMILFACVWMFYEIVCIKTI
jgi:hypothetical protein